MSDEVYDQERDPVMKANDVTSSTDSYELNDYMAFIVYMVIPVLLVLAAVMYLLIPALFPPTDTSLSENTAQKQECLEWAAQETVRIESADGLSTTTISPDTKHCDRL